MKLQEQSIYKLLAIAIFSVVSLIIFVTALIQYHQSKEAIISQMKEKANVSIVALKSNVANFMEAYAPSEYEILIENEMQRGPFAIIVEDRNMANILGQSLYASGKIKGDNENIVDYDIDNQAMNEKLSQCFLKIQEPILNTNKKQIGVITIYYTDEVIVNELNSLIKKSIIDGLFITIFLTFILFIIIRQFILRPLSDFENLLKNNSEKSLPKNNISIVGSKEIFTLTQAFNEMIELIKTSQKELEVSNDSLEKEKLKLNTILRNIPDIVWMKDADGVYLLCNKRFELFFGVNSQEEIIGKTDYDFVDKELADFFREHDKQAMESRVPLSNYEDVPFKSDGHIEPTLTTKVKILNDDGTILGVLGIGKNISELKEKEQELRIQKEEFQTIFEKSKDGIAILDLKSNFLNCNDAYSEMTGFTKEELLQKSCIELTIPEDKEKATEVMKEVLQNGFVSNFEESYLTNDKKIITVSMTLSLMPDKKRVIVVTKDITQNKLLESQAKLVSMGEMIGNIAHQWRQPLSVITTLASGSQLKQEYGMLKPEEFTINMDGIIEQANYLSQTIDDFRNFIKDTHEKTNISLQAVCKQTITLLHAALKNNNITLIDELNDDMLFEGYQNEIIQALINIINNAKDAIKENVLLDDDKLIFFKTKKSANEFEISIQDTGGGIPKDVINRVFEPYFTTKHQNVGTGIGLSMTHKIITEHHHGSIDVQNNKIQYNDKEYYGALFTVRFPLNF